MDTVIIKDGDLRAYLHHAEEAWITFDGERLTGWTGCDELSGTVDRTGAIAFSVVFGVSLVGALIVSRSLRKAAPQEHVREMASTG